MQVIEADNIIGNDPTLIAQSLLARSLKDKVFSSIGTRSLVSIRPNRGLSLFSDTTSKQYAQDAKEISKTNNYNTNTNTQSLPPHVFHISAAAHLHATRAKLDQSIILFGESGSGKSEIHRMLVRNLCDLSKVSKKKTKVQSNVLKVDSILSAFGHASTPINLDATCFTQYSEYQFDSKGRMIGFKVIEYMLEKSRASNPLDGGRSFHIFYYLLDGATHEERTQWHLSDPAHFSYLNGSKLVGHAQGKGTAPMDSLRSNLKSLGIGRRQQTQIWQLLSTVLHLGNIQFLDSRSEREACSIKNFPQLQLVAEMLGVSPSALQLILTCRTKTIGRDNVSSFLTAANAAVQRDYFARALYSICFSWIIEQINLKLCAPDADWSNFVSIVETPGFSGTEVGGNSYHRLLINYANERLYSHIQTELFDTPRFTFQNEGLEFPSTYNSNNEILAVLTGVRTGILPMVDTESSRNSTGEVMAAKVYEDHLNSGIIVTASSKNTSHSFGIHHFNGIVEYDARGFSHLDVDILQSDFVTLVRGNPENPGTTNPFIRNLFSDKLISTRTAGVNIVSAITKTRTPSLRRKPTKTTTVDDENQSLDPSSTVGHMFRVEFNSLLDNISTTQPWIIYCIKPFEGASGKPNVETIQRQVQAYDLPSLPGNPFNLYTMSYPFAEFVARYKPVVNLYERDPKNGCESMIRSKNWKAGDALMGTTEIFLAEKHWKDLELKLKQYEDANAPPSEKGSTVSNSVVGVKADYMNDAFGAGQYEPSVDGSEISDDTASHYESEFDFGDKPVSSARDLEMGKSNNRSKLAQDATAPKKVIPPPPKKEKTRLRKNWLCFTWITTCCYFPCCLRCCGMKSADRQLAWREKFALCVIIFMMNFMALFFIIGIGIIMCPLEKVLSPGEISTLNDPEGTGTVYMYGKYYRIKPIIKSHNSNYMTQTSNTVEYWKFNVLGQDVKFMFPKANSNFAATYCPITVPSGFKLADDRGNSDPWVPHGVNSGNRVQDFIPKVKQYLTGDVVVSLEIVNKAITAQQKYIRAYDRVYDLRPFYDMNLNPSEKSSFFLGDWFKGMADYYTGFDTVQDVSNEFSKLRRQNPTEHDQVMKCLNELFLYGRVDHRNDANCVIPNNILLAASIILVSVIGFKFIGALQFPGQKTPEDHDKFVICQVPCYTEGEVSLHRTIDSLTNLRYDDKHKLLFIICDGMVIGSANDRPTPRIVLDILGVDPMYDPESVAYQSLGDGNGQLNYAKVYSGLYELNGHVVPYLVVVKVGKSSERGKPGNRGKRDSQLVLMRFLMRVHFNQPMSALELEMYHHMKNIIGVDPSFYEYVFMVDADTQVMETSLNHLVSHMTRDAKISGTCGETSIANDKKSFTSMIQVYEYFISHHLAKAFESLFGSVTCLPGCFCMYRVRTSIRNVPVLINPALVEEYSENTVDTLHLKNLLHLGEDRYLTTLTMKYFPDMRTTFCPDAKCLTQAPEKWDVLLSQRRRWINSTVHNLFELARLNELCGFCCISMRFVVIIDLVATFIGPSSLIYIIYLVVLASTQNLPTIPVFSLILLGAVYGLQVIIFLLKTQWQHIGWMIFYILAIPLFGFYIPVYSFWHFDDFSWGKTGLTVDSGENGHPKEEEYFDPDTVPLMKWSEFEAQHIEQSSSDTKSKKSYGTSAYGTPAYGGAAPSSYTESVMSESVASRANFGIVGPNFPSDEELLTEIRHILSTTDLMQVTKKSVRDTLSRFYGVDVSPKKEFIHQCIDGILRGEL
ncbi:chitin synthase-domain-containing protein [Globomyces pollinis-pini]|nr:chitin synthase-domain-containing protein [Globomyces pollinis-pini]